MISHMTHKPRPYAMSGIPARYGTSKTADELAVNEAQANISGGTLALIALGVLAVIGVGAIAIKSKK